MIRLVALQHRYDVYMMPMIIIESQMIVNSTYFTVTGMVTGATHLVSGKMDAEAWLPHSKPATCITERTQYLFSA